MKDRMIHNGYLGSVHYSAPDEVFYGKLEGISDLITFEGKSVKELKSSFISAVEDYLQLCLTTGKEAQKPYHGTFNVRIDPGLHAQAARRSLELGISLNELVNRAINSIVAESAVPYQAKEKSVKSKPKKKT